MRHRLALFACVGLAVLVFCASAAPEATNPFADAIRTASPSVVKVTAATRSLAMGTVQVSIASGVVLSSDGLIATSLSALGQSKRPTVMLADGSQVVAAIVATDPKMDIAILKITAPGLRALEFSTSTPRVGQWVIGIGNPFGLSQTRTDPLSVTVGVISAIHPIQAADYSYGGPLIVSDVIINPGANGGALVDLDGRLVGLCIKEIRSKATNTELSVAVPAGDLSPLLDMARKTSPAPAETEIAPARPPDNTTAPLPVPARPTPSGYLGAYIIDDAKATTGAYVEHVVPGSPAADAGLKEGDVVTTFNGKQVPNGRQLLQQLDPLVVGARVEMTVLRDKKEVKIAATLTRTPRSVLK